MEIPFFEHGYVTLQLADGERKVPAFRLPQCPILLRESCRTMTTDEHVFEGIRPGLHPALGEVSLQQLLATWVVHDLDHVAQIVRTLAKRYTAEVGPWSAYLSILRDRCR